MEKQNENMNEEKKKKELREEITRIEDELNDFHKSLGAIKKSVASMEEDIGALHEPLKNIERAISALEGVPQAINKGVSQLKNLSKDVKMEVKRKAVDLTDRIDKINKSIKELYERIPSTIEENLESQTKSIVKAQEKKGEEIIGEFTKIEGLINETGENLRKEITEISKHAPSTFFVTKNMQEREKRVSIHSLKAKEKYTFYYRKKGIRPSQDVCLYFDRKLKHFFGEKLEMKEEGNFWKRKFTLLDGFSGVSRLPFSTSKLALFSRKVKGSVRIEVNGELDYLTNITIHRHPTDLVGNVLFVLLPFITLNILGFFISGPFQLGMRVVSFLYLAILGLLGLSQ